MRFLPHKLASFPLPKLGSFLPSLKIKLSTKHPRNLVASERGPGAKPVHYVVGRSDIASFPLWCWFFSSGRYLFPMCRGPFLWGGLLPYVGSFLVSWAYSLLVELLPSIYPT